MATSATSENADLFEFDKLLQNRAEKLIIDLVKQSFKL